MGEFATLGPTPTEDGLWLRPRPPPRSPCPCRCLSAAVKQKNHDWEAVMRAKNDHNQDCVPRRHRGGGVSEDTPFFANEYY